MSYTTLRKLNNDLASIRLASIEQIETIMENYKLGLILKSECVSQIKQVCEFDAEAVRSVEDKVFMDNEHLTLDMVKGFRIASQEEIID